jgi:signal transduction histidine kinase
MKDRPKTERQAANRVKQSIAPTLPPSLNQTKSLSAISNSYQSALRKHLRLGSDPSLAAALNLGHRAVKVGLETLDLARIHEAALSSLSHPNPTAGAENVAIQRSTAFFAAAIVPIEATHLAAREANTHMKIIIETLTRRTDELVATNEELREEITHRRAVEEDLRTSEMTSSQLLTKSRHMQEELRQLSRRLLTVQEDERKRISRELHDVIAQTLTGINVRLAVLRSQTTANANDLHRKIAVTERLVEKSVDIVHRFARDLRPTALDDLGLIPALESHIDAFTERTGIPVELAAFAGIEKEDATVRIALYRIAQEALTNIARHANATRVKLALRRLRGSIRMEISDNGRGFPTKPSGKRLGLLGMRERAEMIGGTFTATSSPGKETIIRVDIPSQGGAAKPIPKR